MAERRNRQRPGQTGPSHSGQRGRSRHDLAETLLAAWRTNHRVTVFLVSHVPAAIWATPIPGAPRKTIGMLAGQRQRRCSTALKTLRAGPTASRFRPESTAGM